MQQSYNKAQFEYRKADTRHKIEFGGLGVKAGLIDEPKDVILGALMSIREALDNEPGIRALYQAKGISAFLKKQ